MIAQPDPGGRRRVAILGGGCGGLAAAWALTATPELRERFAVTVYQRDWQLGGKGASGRMPHGNGGQRIEEHGLHIWFGFYARAFRMLREAYEEAGLARGEEWWALPFDKCNSVSLYDRREDGVWIRQPVSLPARGGAGAGPPTEVTRPPLARAVASAIRLLANGVRAELGEGDRRRGAGREVSDQALGSTVATLDDVAAEVESLPSGVLLGGDRPAATRGGRRGLTSIGQRFARERRALLDGLVERLSEHVSELREDLARSEVSDRVRLWRGVLELVSASVAGMLRDGLLWHGLGEIDNEDFREWLGRHGASVETLERSPVLRGLYDLTFAYRGGDKRHPSLAAGKGLQSLLMMVNYQGAFMWRMRAGMGDVVFSPLYLALKDRGVQFHFFSRVTALRLAPGRPLVESIELVREATMAAGPAAYVPIERVGDWWCWPSSPYVDQLEDREERPEALARGADFDDVVLAIPVGALPEICGELADANPRFRQMLEGSQTVRTKALQLWTTRTIEELRQGARDAAGPPLDPPATAYAEPFDTYCDMSHLLGAEGYGPEGPKGIAYFCAVLPDEVSEDDSTDQVHTLALSYLEQQARTIWPGAFDGEELNWEVLFDPHGRGGPERLDAQYVRANTDASDRYVTTPAGSVDSRLEPDESGFENLVLAGDWTHNDIDGGCVEAAVISGERAGEALIARAGAQAGHRGAIPRTRRAARVAQPDAGLDLAAPNVPVPVLPRYVEFGALATAPGPLECERARLYCFFVSTERSWVQGLCDRVLKEPTGGALRYRVPRAAPVVLSFGTINGLRSLDAAHADWGSATEPEAAIWIPTVAERWEAGRYVSDHLAVFMPYIWVDDPIAFASGREVYGFPKTQGWMTAVGDPRQAPGTSEPGPPDPPDELALDVHGAVEYSPAAELGRRRLLTVRRGRGPTRGGGGAAAEGSDLGGLVDHFLAELDPDWDLAAARPVRRGGWVGQQLSTAKVMATGFAELLTEQVVRHAFLKQIRDSEHGDQAALQQVVEARSSVTPSTLRWRRLSSRYELAVEPLASHPLEDDLGLQPAQTVERAFVAEFGFRMEPGRVVWPQKDT